MKHQKILMFLICLLYIPIAFFAMELFGLFNDYTTNQFQLQASSLDVMISNFQIGKDTPNGIQWFKHNSDGSFDVALIQDDIIEVQFTVRNESSIDVSIEGTLELFFVNEAGEQSILMLYPENISNDQIRENALQKSDSEALIGLNVDDTKPIQSSNDLVHGYRETIIRDTLTGQPDEGMQSKQYTFKLYMNPLERSLRELRTILTGNKIGMNLQIQAKPINPNIQWNAQTAANGVVSTDIQIPPAVSLTLLGDNPFYMIKDSPYVEPGFTALDEFGDAVEVQIKGNVDTTKYGITTLEYRAEHKGVVEVKTRTVYVTDGSQPVITPYKNKVEQFIVNDFDLSKLVSLSDNTDSEKTLKSNLEITTPEGYSSKKPGVYQVCYNVSDTTGLKATETCIELTIFGFKESAPMYETSLALTTHGRVYSWGYSGTGETGRGSVGVLPISGEIETLREHNIVQVSGGQYHGMALSDEGRVFIWGNDGYGVQGNGRGAVNNTVPAELTGLGTVIQIDTKFYTALALNDVGEVYSWGSNAYNASGLGNVNNTQVPTKMSFPEPKKIKYISMGYYTGYAISENNQLYSWGNNGYGEGLVQRAGTISKPTNVTNLLPEDLSVDQIKQIEIGQSHAYILTYDGSIYAWGLNAYGQLGNETVVNSRIPTQIPYFKENQIKIEKIEAAAFYGMALDDKGVAYAWGYSNYGAFASERAYLEPIVLNIGQNQIITSIGAHLGTTGLITSDSYLYMAGSNNYRELGVNINLDPIPYWNMTVHPSMLE